MLADTIKSISRTILGELPVEFEFLYMIFDFLQVILVILSILAPFILIYCLLRK